MWYYSPTKDKLIYQVRAKTYDFWLSGQYGKYKSNIFLFHPLGPFPSKMMRCPWILCFDLLPLQYIDLTHEIWRFHGPRMPWSIYFLDWLVQKFLILCTVCTKPLYCTVHGKHNAVQSTLYSIHSTQILSRETREINSVLSFSNLNCNTPDTESGWQCRDLFYSFYDLLLRPPSHSPPLFP